MIFSKIQIVLDGIPLFEKVCKISLMPMSMLAVTNTESWKNGIQKKDLRYFSRLAQHKDDQYFQLL